MRGFLFILDFIVFRRLEKNGHMFYSLIEVFIIALYSGNLYHSTIDASFFEIYNKHKISIL